MTTPAWRRALFTLNNPTAAEKRFWYRLCTDERVRQSRDVRYVIYQLEIGTNNGQPHFQGYVEITSRHRLRWWKRKFTPFGTASRCHWEMARGTAAQNRDYCRKNDTYSPGGERHEWGTPADTRGPRQDQTALVTDIQDGVRRSIIMQRHPKKYLQHGANIDRMIHMNTQERNWKMKVHILYGDTGTGKSWTANQWHNDIFKAMWPHGNRWWWDDYEGEECVSLDEFRHQIKFDKMLQLLDRYPWRVETKGGTTNFRSKILIITTNLNPYTEWYPGVNDKTMLYRRFQDFCTFWKFELPPNWDQQNNVKAFDDIIKEKVQWNGSRFESIENIMMTDETTEIFRHPMATLIHNSAEEEQAIELLGYGMEPTAEPLAADDLDFMDAIMH